MPYKDPEVRRQRGYEVTKRRRAAGLMWPSDLISGAKRRARDAGVECTLSTQWVRERLVAGCAVSGLPFDLETGKGRWVKRPFTPSIDRIEAGGPYVESNCRLVCLIVNEAMNAWGLEPLLTLARSLTK